MSNGSGVQNSAALQLLNDIIADKQKIYTVRAAAYNLAVANGLDPATIDAANVAMLSADVDVDQARITLLQEMAKPKTPSTPVITVTAAGATVTLNFSIPVVIRGNIPLNLSGGQALVSQTVVNPQQVTQNYGGPVSGSTYSIPANTPEIAVAAASGTFP